jgi:L-lactate dehydrogenase complex protein LldG
MLAAIRERLAASAPFDAVHDAQQTQRSLRVVPVGVAVARETHAAPVERFRDALEDVAGHCVVVPDEVEAAEAVRRIIEQARARRVAVSDAPLVRSVLAHAQLDAELLEQASASALFDCDVGITSAQWAVAETGTLVLESEAERHRLPSLVPPMHVALIEARQVRQTLGEVFATLDEQGRDGLSRTMTFITGPSRTSDIELTLAIGVHGPGELFVIIIEEATR